MRNVCLAYDSRQCPATHGSQNVIERELGEYVLCSPACSFDTVPVMKCPYCHIDNDRVIDSRSSDEGFSIRRRRECLGCKRRYTTYERIEELSIKVVKKDGVREPLQREKIRVGIAKACWKRPVSDAQIDVVVNEAIDEVAADFDQEVPSREIGERVMAGLARLDQVAYVRFASVYREFKDVRDFVEELKPMLDAAEKNRQGSEK